MGDWLVDTTGLKRERIAVVLRWVADQGCTESQHGHDRCGPVDRMMCVPCMARFTLLRDAGEGR